MSLAKNVRRLRNEQGLTQQSLAEAIEVRTNTVYRIEAGMILNPTRRTMEGLCRALGVDEDELKSARRRRKK